MQEEYEDMEMEGMEEEGSEFTSYEELMDARKITAEDVKEHMTGPVISTIIHIIVLAFVGTIVVFKAPDEKEEIMVEMKTLEIKEIEPPPPPPPEPIPPTQDDPTETPVEMPNPEVEVNVKIDKISIDQPSDIDMPSMLNVKMSNSALKMAIPAGGGTPVGGRFLGTGGSGTRFMFIIDYSASMKKNQLLVVKSHLMKALKAFNGKGQIAILFFSGPVWLPQEDSKAIRNKWSTAGQDFHCTKDGVEKLYPKVKWMKPSAHNLEILDKYICKTGITGGTHWAHPFKVALTMREKPSVIFFMTDGAVDANKVAQCMELVKEYGQNITINTISFGTKKGGKDLEALAKLSRGGVYKGYDDNEINTMATGITLPANFTDNTDLDYSKPVSVKAKKEKKVKGLTIK